MRSTAARTVALGTAVAIGSVQIVGSIGTGDLPGNGDSWALGATGIIYAVLGWWVTGQRRDLRIGWLFLAAGFVTTTVALASWWAEVGLMRNRGPEWLAATAAWCALWASPIPIMLAKTAPLVLLPDGTPRSRRGRVFLTSTTVLVGALVVASAGVGAAAARSTPRALLGGVKAPGGSAADAASGFSALGWLVAHVAVLVALGALVAARRRAGGTERGAYSTVLVGAAVTIAALVGTALVEPLSGGDLSVPESVGALISGVAIPAAVAAGVLRFGLLEIRALVSRTLLVAATVVGLVAAYLGVLWLTASAAGTVFDVDPAGVAAAAAVGIASAFVAIGSRSVALRWFGRGTDVGMVARRFDESGPAADAAPLDLQRLAATVKDELRLGSVDLRFLGSVASVGEPAGPTKSVLLAPRGSKAGELIVTARPGEALSKRDEDLLEEIARYVALAAEAVSLNEQLLMAQRAVESARSDERRRVRMDLHDGVGPALAAIRLKLVAHARSTGDHGAVAEAADAISDAIGEVRRIVEGLQPSMLEDLGLVAALQILVADAADFSGMAVTLDAAPDLTDVPPDAARTAYRMAAEAVANAVRHSGASRCTVDLRQVGGELRLRVVDDGSGFEPGHEVGMGLHSIRDRAAKAGGTAQIESLDGTGTVVSASLPLELAQ